MANSGSEHADSGWDDYAERVLRNEGRLTGLESLFAETREADRKLIEQRSDSLAQELERRAEAVVQVLTARADAVLALSREERAADRREIAAINVELDRRQALLRELNNAAISANYEQSHTEIKGIDERSRAALEQLTQQVQSWRTTDREARELFAKELSRHLDTLNHNNERMASFQANTVTRELWQAEKDASMSREGILRDQIIAIDRLLLTMTPLSQSDKSHREMLERMERSLGATAQVLDNKIAVVSEKVSDLKTYRDETSGRSSGYNAVYAWGIAAITVIISVIILLNSLRG